MFSLPVIGAKQLEFANQGYSKQLTDSEKVAFERISGLFFEKRRAGLSVKNPKLSEEKSDGLFGFGAILHSFRKGLPKRKAGRFYQIIETINP